MSDLNVDSSKTFLVSRSATESIKNLQHRCWPSEQISIRIDQKLSTGSSGWISVRADRSDERWGGVFRNNIVCVNINFAAFYSLIPMQTNAE